MLRDAYERAIDYLRLSVTDRCNLRCVYCMPESTPHRHGRDNALTDDEIVDLVRAFTQAGVSKLRVTGGEPLVRPGLAELVRRLARVEGVTDVSLSTNGVLLTDLAAELKSAGLSRVNISLDTLRPERFARIARFGSMPSVLRGIDAALDAGLDPVKLNVVVARGMNDDELDAFADLARERPLHVRFIELMPMGETGFFSSERRVALPEMMAQIGPLEAVALDARPRGHGPARYHRRPGAAGTIGFISALSCGFCDACNRIRLTSKGTLVPCLDATDGVDLRAALRAGASTDALSALIAAAVHAKPERHDMNARLSGEDTNTRYMCSIGG